MDFKITKMKQDYRYEMKQEHYHDYHEIYYLISGKRKMFLGSKVYTLEAGDLVMIPKGEIHRTTFENEFEEDNVETFRVVMSFSEAFVSDFVKQLKAKSYEKCFGIRKVSVPLNKRAGLEALFDQLLIEHKDRDELSEYLCKSYCGQVLAFFMRMQDKKEDEEKTLLSSDLDMEKAAQYISNHFQNQITLDFIARKYCMSNSYFSKRFKMVTGFGFKEYLNTVRIRHACDLLLTSDDNITEISYQCGFTDSNYFGDAFRKIMNVSPREYRKSNLIR